MPDYTLEMEGHDGEELTKIHEQPFMHSHYKSIYLKNLFTSRPDGSWGGL